jgi:uncharacterized protein (DUF486 family)
MKGASPPGKPRHAHRRHARRLKHPDDWGVAFFEYCLAVPANRIGHGTFTAPQLKVIQEVVTLVVFAAFAVLYLGEAIRWNYAAACVCMVGAVFFIMNF